MILRPDGDFTFAYLQGDPADRIIAAGCLEEQAPLITRDRRLQEWKHLRTIW